METKRRELLKASAALAAAALVRPPLAQPFIATPGSELIGKGGKRRVVICGAGWGGLTAARLREQAPELEVVVLERNPVFWSCPMSNKWLIDVVDTSYLMHGYSTPTARYGFTFVQTEISEIDRSKKRVHTAQGFLDYDWLILSAGIRVAYEPWFGNDRRAIEHTRLNYASAYVPNAEHFGLKKKIQSFKGGTMVMTLPPPPHRCPPSPYERACLMAAHYKKNKIPAKIIILDPKPRIAPITIGYQQAFQELYADIITYVPNAAVREVDPFNKSIKTAAGDFKFDDAILMGHHQAAELAWKADVIGKTAEGKPSNWAAVDPQFYWLKDDQQVYVIGDSVGQVSPQFGHYPKAGHVANRQARCVARYIASQAKGQAPQPIIIDNLCYMLVDPEKKEGISVQFDYKMGPEGHLIQTQIDNSDRSAELWREDLRWYAIMMNDFAGA